MKILFVTKTVPGHKMSGQGIRILAQYKALLELGKIDNVLVGKLSDWGGDWPAEYGELIACLPHSPFNNNLKLFYRDVNKDPPIFRAAHFLNLKSIYRPQPQIAKKFADIAKEYDVVFISGLEVAWSMGWCDQRSTIVDLDDVPSQHFRPLDNINNPLQRFLSKRRFIKVSKDEGKSLGDYRLSLVCSNDDANYLKHSKIAVLQNCVLPDPAIDLRPLDGHEGRMLFVGSLTHGLNKKGIAWFIAEVLPLIRDIRRDAILQTVGFHDPNALPHWYNSSGVDFVGTVNSPVSYIRRSQIGVCPLLEGYGTRVKIIESLLFAEPVVATTIGAYGLSFEEEDGVIRRDNPKEFAQACVDLLENKERRNQLGSRGKQKASSLYGFNTFRKKMHFLVNSIV